jgi:hypothetical protein
MKLRSAYICQIADFSAAHSLLELKFTGDVLSGRHIVGGSKRAVVLAPESDECGTLVSVWRCAVDAGLKRSGGSRQHYPRLKRMRWC